MEFVLHIIDFFVHLDHHLNAIIDDYGTWTYLIVFVIVFCETGLVFTPFLPGDSLLFALGTLSAGGPLKGDWLFFVLAGAAILGDSANYWIGHLLAPKVFKKEHIRFLRQDHLERTHQFFEKYGGKTIIIARFIPIIRTFAPFLAGVGAMTYGKFFLYNVVGGILWVASFLTAGYFFGNLPIVKRNFTLVIFVIIIISILPGVFEYLNHRRTAKPSPSSK